MFTRDRFQTDPNGSGPKIGSDRPSVYTGPFWNRSETDPKLDLLFDKSNFGSVPDSSRTVPCKQKPIRSGSVRNGSGSVRSRVNVA